MTNVLNKKWFDKECRLKQHEVRKLANKKHRDPTNTNTRIAYHSALKTYKETLEIKKNQFQNEKLIELERAAPNDPNSFWKTLQNMSDETQNANNNNNTPRTDEWFNHFSKLHSNHQLNQDHHDVIKTLIDKEKTKDENNILDTEIAEHEIRNNALKLKPNKAVYADKIKNEMIKASADILVEGYTKLLYTQALDMSYSAI